MLERERAQADLVFHQWVERVMVEVVRHIGGSAILASCLIGVEGYDPAPW